MIAFSNLITLALILLDKACKQQTNLDAFKTCVQNTRDNLKEFSRIGVNAAKTFEQTSRDTTTARPVGF